MSTMLKLGEKAEEKADKIWQEVYGEKDDGNTPKDDGTPKDQPKDEPKPEDKPKEEPKPEEKPKEEPKPEDDFKQKYDVLQGKYNAEVPRMAMDLAEANKKIADLEKKVSDIPKPEPKKEEPKPLSPKLKLLKDEYPDIYEAVIELQQEKISEAKTQFKEEVDKTVGKVTEKVDKVDEKVTVSNRERFEHDIRSDSEVGKDIDAINNDPKFKEWLSETDDYTGLSKAELATDAIKRMDKDTTLKFFRNFKKERMAPSPKVEDKPKDTPKKEEPKPKTLDINPPRGGGSTMVTDEEVTTITPDSLRNHYTERSQGKWKGKEQEWEAEEKRIHAALMKHLYGKKT